VILSIILEIISSIIVSRLVFAEILILSGVLVSEPSDRSEIML
jgi:hypothetical protein